MRRGRRLLTELVTCVALAWTAAPMAAQEGKPIEPPGRDARFCPSRLQSCQVDLGWCTGDLRICAADLSTCSDDLGTCRTDVDTCEDALAACEATQFGLAGDGYADTEWPPGSHGPQLAYEDCGDGTIVDLKTGLMWEKKVEGGGFDTCLSHLHEVDSTCPYPWASRQWINAVNAESYAGHSDWRIPNVKELQSIVDYSAYSPAIHPVFGPVALTDYISATYISDPDSFGIWVVNFLNGWVEERHLGHSHMRAVRDGLCP